MLCKKAGAAAGAAALLVHYKQKNFAGIRSNCDFELFQKIKS
jgi:hypothetical protein